MGNPNSSATSNEADHETQAARSKTRRRITIIAVSCILLIAVAAAAAVGVTQTNKKDSRNNNTGASASVKTVCAATLHPDSCYNSLAPLVKSGDLKPQDLLKLSVQITIDALSAAADRFFDGGAVASLNITDRRTLAAVDSCRELFSLALDHLNASLAIRDTTVGAAFEDLRTWLSPAATYQQTCIDELSSVSSELGSLARVAFENSTVYNSNSLAFARVEESIDRLGGIGRRRLLGSGGVGLPEWVSVGDRRLLGSSREAIRADVVVAKEGSSGVKTIAAALKKVPEKSGKRFVIYVKKGVYVENVRVEKNMWNVMMIGDGKNESVVSGSLNFIDGTPTFQTATFGVAGQGFIARDMGFINTAGPAKHQAVALMSTADHSVFYRCKIDGYQDTLYAHSNRQFYRDCDIYGTVDFIFGNSAVVIQNCNIMPKKPMLGQQNTISAQGKIDPNQNTGISIQNCIIAPAANLTGVSNFLGRPWKNYSTIIYFNNKMDNFIHPRGWLPWVGTTAPDTIFYAEYQNSGPGAMTKNRVNWRGLKLNLNANQVKKFTVEKFINGDKWIPTTNVTYKSGL